MSDRIPSAQSRRHFLQSVGAAGGVAVLGGVLPLHRALAAGAPPAIILGQIAPMTGSAAEFGPYYRDAVQLAVDQINMAAKEVFGGPIIAKHLTADSATLPTVGVQAARQMIDTQKTPVIINGWSSGVTVAVATSATIPAGVLQIGNGTTSPLVTVLPADAKADLLFRTSASDAMQGVVAAQFVNGEFDPNYKFKRVSTIYINNPYGQGLSNAFTNAFKKRGGTVLAEVPHPEEVQPTYKSMLSQALKDKPDLLIIVSYPAHTIAICKESRDSFNFTNWQFTDGNASIDIIKEVGEKDMDGRYGTAPGEDTSTQSYKDFSKNFLSTYKYDHFPPFTTCSYDAGMVAGLAMAAVVAAGATDASKITGTVLRDQLRKVANPPGEMIDGGDQARVTEMLKALKAGKEINYNGAAGPCDFDKNGDVITPVNIWKYSGDKIETVKMIPAKDIPEA
ncbi:ABC transporter substrate-binding protein [Pusillimonas sp. ANT_WB101]|uniref:ABC transporter substrate-binding protein n=1 Tax=Pusillimonas sp. ANT_WB101 TaxID=2597356 RepID=UPI0011EFDA57|nr:ABC transporter substrate-binding protein [Pusillimonas sp. ANT_WB101]KAA0889364.1 ABC transporter substrate-binding protein [Pusillimonas sp. ANT_WB101]